MSEFTENLEEYNKRNTLPSNVVSLFGNQLNDTSQEGGSLLASLGGIAAATAVYYSKQKKDKDSPEQKKIEEQAQSESASTVSVEPDPLPANPGKPVQSTSAEPVPPQEAAVSIQSTSAPAEPSAVAPTQEPTPAPELKSEVAASTSEEATKQKPTPKSTESPSGESASVVSKSVESSGQKGGQIGISGRHDLSVIRDALKSIYNSNKKVDLETPIQVHLNNNNQFGGSNRRVSLIEIVNKNNKIYGKLDNGKKIRINNGIFYKI